MRWPLHIVSGHGEFLELVLCSVSIEYEHGGAPCGEPGGREHGLEDGIFVVFAGNDDPHVDSGAVHECGQQVVHPFLQDLVHDAGFFPQAEDLCVTRHVQ